jgi:hypothetical protein
MAKGTSFLSQFPMFVVKLFLSIFHSLPPMILFYSYFIAYKLFLKILQSFKTYPHVSSTLIMSHLWNYWTDLEWICSAEVKNSWSYTSRPPIRLHSVVTSVCAHFSKDSSTILTFYSHPRSLFLLNLLQIKFNSFLCPSFKSFWRFFLVADVNSLFLVFISY